VTAATDVPLVSIIIRSYKRRDALKELVGRLRTQGYPRFEIVVLEMSDDPALVAELAALGESRLHVVVSPPRDPPAARNAAIRRSRGEILLLVDDDDLPMGDDFIALHAENYADPRCMGVVGRLVSDPSHTEPPRFPRVVRAFAMRHTFFLDSIGLAYGSLRKEGIDYLIGSNASVRRSLVERLGGWDEGIPMNEEQSFAIKFARERSADEYFVFDPRPQLWRRTNIDGGLARRSRADWHLRELEARLFYYREIVGHYYPLRYKALTPLFIARGIQQTLFWIWDADNRHRTLSERARAMRELVTALPGVLRFERFSSGAVKWTTQWT
jgi:glycosyltransferase involved in cell wall biosynthesis